jgi:hypothetical protein
MSIRTSVSIAVVVAAFVIGAVWAYAQGPALGVFGNGLDLVAPTVVAGNDLGFRVESTKDNVAVGKFVIRVNGRCVEAQVGSSGIMPAGAR